MDFSKIVCIEIRKYNQDQLTKIAESLGFEANPSDENFFNLFTCKKSKVEKVYIIPGETGPFALKYKKEVGVDSPEQLYKDTLFIYPAYRGLSKKEKDRLMKLESFDFFKKKSKSVDYRDALIERLKTSEEEQYYYLKAALEDNWDEPQAFLLALKNIADARGFSTFAEDAGLSRESLYRTLSENGNPKLDTLFKMLHSMGMKLTVEPLEKEQKVS
jgi:probable addiction module antidote protein